jgi:hypothetical protein
MRSRQHEEVAYRAGPVGSVAKGCRNGRRSVICTASVHTREGLDEPARGDKRGRR